MTPAWFPEIAFVIVCKCLYLCMGPFPMLSITIKMDLNFPKQLIIPHSWFTHDEFLIAKI